MGKLYLVATPIGNLADITIRAINILKEARLIAAEDTRHTYKLLKRYDIDRPLISYHEFNKLARLDQILAALAEGDVALVSDAGTPGLNDPGYELVRAVVEAGYLVSPIPGPSAPLAALVSSGLPTDAFLYLGYLPRKPAERRRFLASVAALPYTLVVLETPHRLVDALADIHEMLGDRWMCAARELTKLHEELLRGTVRQVRQHFIERPPRGELTLVLAGSSPVDQSWSDERLDDEIHLALLSGKKPSQIAGELASRSDRPRREIYELVRKLNEETRNEPG